MRIDPEHRPRDIHRESLLRIPLVRQMMVDPQIQWQPRAIDAGWRYSECLSRPAGGFNPWCGKIMYPIHSRLQQWLTKPHGSARTLNEGDFLTQEVLFAVHDYLHHWSYLAMNDLRPQLELGWGPITAKNFEDYVFCHLISEAAAVTGLDYWLMCTRSVDSFCPIGSRIEAITVSYRESLLPEYRHFNPKFTVQEPEFFNFLANFYCSGHFIGFNKRDTELSPKLLRWLEHEVGYGETQRVYTRTWLTYLSRSQIPINATQAARPVAVDKPWKKRLIEDLGNLLWEKVKEDRLHRFRSMPSPQSRWRRDPDKPLDYRLLNFNELARTDEARESVWQTKAVTDVDIVCFLKQFVVRHDFKSLDLEYAALIGRLVESGDVRGVLAALKDKPRVRSVGPEPLDLMVLT